MPWSFHGQKAASNEPCSWRLFPMDRGLPKHHIFRSCQELDRHRKSASWSPHKFWEKLNRKGFPHLFKTIWSLAWTRECLLDDTTKANRSCRGNWLYENLYASNKPRVQKRNTCRYRLQLQDFARIKRWTFGLFLDCGQYNGFFALLCCTHIWNSQVGRINPCAER